LKEKRYLPNKPTDDGGAMDFPYIIDESHCKLGSKSSDLSVKSSEKSNMREVLQYRAIFLTSNAVAKIMFIYVIVIILNLNRPSKNQQLTSNIIKSELDSCKLHHTTSPE
jgi:hypothetical protein